MHRHHLQLIACLMFCIAACSQESGQAPQAEQKAGILDQALSTIQLDTTEGAKLAQRKCGTCHYFDRNLRKVGPSLKGIYGRKPAISDLPFEVWDETSLDKWIEDPKQVKPKTKMAIPGIKNADERAAIIAYLKQL